MQNQTTDELVETGRTKHLCSTNTYTVLKSYYAARKTDVEADGHEKMMPKSISRKGMIARTSMTNRSRLLKIKLHHPQFNVGVYHCSERAKFTRVNQRTVKNFEKGTLALNGRVMPLPIQGSD